jgi:hypothetical protein
MPSTLLLRSWQITTFILATAATAVVALSLFYAPRVVVPGVEGFLGYNFAPAHFNRLYARRVAGFDPESPLPSAGIKVGDLIVDPPRGSFEAGEIVRLQVANGDTVRTIQIRVARIDRLSTPMANVLDLCLVALIFLVGFLVALRRRRDVSGLAFACALFIAASVLVPTSIPTGRLAGSIEIWAQIGGVFALAALGYFSIVLNDREDSRARSWIATAIAGLCLAWTLWCSVAMVPVILGRVIFRTDTLLPPVYTSAQIAALLLCVFAFVDTWRHVGTELRPRLRWLFVGFVLAIVGFALATFDGLLGLVPNSSDTPLALAASLLLVYGASLASMTYAILRHRVLDVGFVVSRTLVFTTFTGLLLILFGAVEWLLSHFIHVKQRGGNVLLDGTIAIAIYLIFHRVRHGMEYAVERVIFRTSHERLAQLNHFLETVPHFSDPEALAEAFLKSLDGYVDSAGSGIYRRDQTGRFLLERSTLAGIPEALAPDAQLLVELRTSHRASHFLHIGLDTPVLTVPVIRRSELVGFLVISEKNAKTLYRPDEVENVVRAVHQVSSDLYALRLERVEQEKEKLRRQNDLLRRELRAIRAP